ncbi:MAG: hypothetical protein ACYDCC_07215 [Actinomycetota bacterium]
MAEALIERGTVDIVTNGAPLHAELHIFSDGTGVFEYSFGAPYGSSSRMSRVEAQTLSATHVARYLEHALLNCKVRPMAGQDE